MGTAPSVVQTSDAIPRRKFGKQDIEVSALGFGGHHLGDADDERAAVSLVQEAVDAGITFFDNCWEYRRGQTEIWMGKGLKGRRDKIFLMTKLCTHGREGTLAARMLEESLRRLQTDHLDLWQLHGVSFENDPDLFMRPGGAAEAMRNAKEQGKVRFVGFTGHKDPAIHLKMLATEFPFDSVQMPLNAFDANFHSFEKEVLPEVSRRGMAALGMKPFNGHGDPVLKGAITAEEALRYAMSLPVTTTITGMGKSFVLQQNLKIARNFKPMTANEMQALRDRTRADSQDGRYELYKVSMKFDNPEARFAHNFPIDSQQAEIKDILQESKNTGHPFRQKEQQ